MEVGVVRGAGLMKLRVMLATSVVLLVPLAVLSNVTHSMALALEAYHMLYNVLTLVGSLLALRMARRGGSAKNTYGWRRLEVLVVVTSLLFLAALCFSVTVEAVQSIVHAGHQDTIHHPVYIMGAAAAVLLANLLCYVLIGGYTNMQSTFLTTESLSASDDAVALPDKPKCPALEPGAGGELAGARPPSGASVFSPYSASSRLWLHFLRDIGGTLLLALGAAVVYCSQHWLVQYLDPVLAILGACVLMATSRPLMSSCCMILLQNMPETFDAERFSARLMQRCPVIEDVHELHVWQLTPNTHVATAHVVLPGPCQFAEVALSVKAFFAEHGIGHVTVQPEFCVLGTACGRCLLPCKGAACESARCCRGVPTPPAIKVTPPSQASLHSMEGGGEQPGAAEPAGPDPDPDPAPAAADL